MKSPERELHGLKDLEGAAANLVDTIASHKATVLFWYGTACPCVLRYHERIHALRDAFATQEVAFVAIASNADDDAKRVDESRQARGFELPILMDPQGRFAVKMGVRSTPTVVILDDLGQVRFRGWIDNERLPGVEGRIPYAENVLQSILTPNAPRVAEKSPAYGCRITRALGEASECAEVRPSEPPPCTH
ncbi:MAG: redoxin family protein [Deltaproteobacteria bacterium]|nr:redoxin family protein [Deltaproteobacteria bacterium]